MINYKEILAFKYPTDEPHMDIYVRFFADGSFGIGQGNHFILMPNVRPLLAINNLVLDESE